MTKLLEDLLTQVKDRAIDRRAFMNSGLAAGISLSMLNVAADRAFAQSAEPTLILKKGALEAEVDGVLNALTSPVFVDRMTKFKALQGDYRLSFAKEAMTPNALGLSGVPLPKGMRISSRVFEEDSATGYFMDYDEGQNILNMLEKRSPERNIAKVVRLVPDGKDAWACACGGAATVCGGAGGGPDLTDAAFKSTLTPGYEKKLHSVMKANYMDLIDFVVRDDFNALVSEMYALPPKARPSYVSKVLTNPDELKIRGVTVPDGILIQRSSFGDLRPTLFVVKKYLPDGYRYAWENVNLTFDQDTSKSTYSGVDAWRKPLPFDVQSELSGQGMGAFEVEEMKQHFGLTSPE